jgi:predicted  nucleic acid-binding Zn-ribbon protein
MNFGPNRSYAPRGCPKAGECTYSRTKGHIARSKRVRDAALRTVSALGVW